MWPTLLVLLSVAGYASAAQQQQQQQQAQQPQQQQVLIPQVGNSRHTVASIAGDLMIGALVPVHERPSAKQAQSRICGAVREQYGIQRVEVAFRTIDSINADPNILPNITLGIEIRDSCWHSPIALEQSIEFIRDAMAASEQRVNHLLPAVQPVEAGGSGANAAAAAAAAANSSALAAQCASHLLRQQSKRVKNIVGVVGPASSTDTVQVQNLLQLFNMPQLGYSATSRDLSNKNFFKYFLRVVPSDKLQAQVMIDLMLAHNWTYITVAYTEGSYGSSLMNAFRERAQEVGICFATLESMPPNADDAKFDELIEAIQKHPNARVVICMCEGRTLGKLFAGFKRKNIINEYLVVGSDGWSDRFDVVEKQEEYALGGISIRIHSAYVDDFDDYYFQLNPFTNHRNPWFAEFWETRFQCNLVDTSNSQQSSTGTSANQLARTQKQQQPQRPFIRPPGAKVYNRTCTGRESLRNNHKQDAKMAFVQKSIITMALGLDSMQRAICPTDGPGLCAEMLPVNGSTLLAHLMNVSFSFLDEKVSFDEQGDPPGRYEILNFQRRRPLLSKGSPDIAVMDIDSNESDVEGEEDDDDNVGSNEGKANDDDVADDNDVDDDDKLSEEDNDSGEEITGVDETSTASQVVDSSSTSPSSKPTRLLVKNRSKEQRRRQNPLYNSYNTLRVLRIPTTNSTSSSSSSASSASNSVALQSTQRKRRRRRRISQHKKRRRNHYRKLHPPASGYSSTSGYEYVHVGSWQSESGLSLFGQIHWPSWHSGSSGSGGGSGDASGAEQWQFNPSEQSTNSGSNRVASGAGNLPKSVCALPCPQGHAKKIQSDSVKCCWVCVLCRPNEYLLNEFKCKACEKGWWPNSGRTGCDQIPIQFLEWRSMEALTAISIALFGLTLTLATGFVFIRHNNTPVVKSTTRELSYMILFAMILCYANTFFLVARPRTATCFVTRILPGFAFAMMYGALVTKTNRIARILAGSKKKIITRRLRFMSATSQVAITWIIVLIECTIIVLMLIREPANSALEYPSDERVVLVCNTTTMGIIAPLGFDFFLIAMCTLYAFKTRNVPENFNEAKFIGFTMYTTLVIWIAFVVIYLSSEHKNNRSFFTTTKNVRCHIGYQIGSAGAAAAAAAAATANQQPPANQLAALLAGSGQLQQHSLATLSQLNEFSGSAAQAEAPAQLARSGRTSGWQASLSAGLAVDNLSAATSPNNTLGSPKNAMRPALWRDDTQVGVAGGQARALRSFWGNFLSMFSRRSRRKQFDKTLSIQQHLRAIRAAENLDRKTHFRRSQVQRLMQRFDFTLSNEPLEQSSNSAAAAALKFANHPLQVQSAHSHSDAHNLTHQLKQLQLLSKSEQGAQLLIALGQLLGPQTVWRLAEALRRYCNNRIVVTVPATTTTTTTNGPFSDNNTTNQCANNKRATNCEFLSSYSNTNKTLQPTSGSANSNLSPSSLLMMATLAPLDLDRHTDRALGLTMLRFLLAALRRAQSELDATSLAATASTATTASRAMPSNERLALEEATSQLTPLLVSNSLTDTIVVCKSANTSKQQQQPLKKKPLSSSRLDSEVEPEKKLSMISNSNNDYHSSCPLAANSSSSQSQHDNNNKSCGCCCCCSDNQTTAATTNNNNPQGNRIAKGDVIVLKPHDTTNKLPIAVAAAADRKSATTNNNSSNDEDPIKRALDSIMGTNSRAKKQQASSSLAKLSLPATMCTNVSSSSATNESRQQQSFNNTRCSRHHHHHQHPVCEQCNNSNSNDNVTSQRPLIGRQVVAAELNSAADSVIQQQSAFPDAPTTSDVNKLKPLSQQTSESAQANSTSSPVTTPLNGSTFATQNTTNQHDVTPSTACQSVTEELLRQQQHNRQRHHRHHHHHHHNNNYHQQQQQQQQQSIVQQDNDNSQQSKQSLMSNDTMVAELSTSNVNFLTPNQQSLPEYSRHQSPSPDTATTNTHQLVNSSNSHSSSTANHRRQTQRQHCRGSRFESALSSLSMTTTTRTTHRLDSCNSTSTNRGTNSAELALLSGNEASPSAAQATCCSYYCCPSSSSGTGEGCNSGASREQCNLVRSARFHHRTHKSSGSRHRSRSSGSRGASEQRSNLHTSRSTRHLNGSTTSTSAAGAIDCECCQLGGTGSSMKAEDLDAEKKL